MAKTETSAPDARPAAASVPFTPIAALAPAIGWLIPGAGHLIQKRWTRGLLLMFAVVAMFAFGLAMEGKVYKPNTGDLLDILGFIGDLGSGALYIMGRIFEWGGTNITTANADYGTKYIVVAGLLNIMAAVDAYHIAIGKKQ
jgi:4-amino-4-deoxy-L-arabinose transferase-like glycosyltransferase